MHVKWVTDQFCHMRHSTVGLWWSSRADIRVLLLSLRKSEMVENCSSLGHFSVNVIYFESALNNFVEHAGLPFFRWDFGLGHQNNTHKIGQWSSTYDVWCNFSGLACWVQLLIHKVLLYIDICCFSTVCHKESVLCSLQLFSYILSIKQSTTLAVILL